MADIKALLRTTKIIFIVILSDDIQLNGVGQNDILLGTLRALFRETIYPAGCRKDVVALRCGRRCWRRRRRANGNFSAK